MANAIVTVDPKQQNTSPTNNPFSYTLTVEGTLMLGLTAGVMWQYVIRPQILKFIERTTGGHRYDADRKIQHILAELVGITGACRAVLYEFHNGGRLSSGRHFERVSITNQYSHPGYAVINILDAPFSILSNTVNKLEAADTYLVRETLTCTKDDPKCQILVGYGVTHTIEFLIERDGYPIGIVGLHFNSSNLNGHTDWLVERAERSQVAIANLKTLLDDAGKERGLFKELYKIVKGK